MQAPHSCDVGCQLFRIGFIPFTSAALVSRVAGRQFPGGYLAILHAASRHVWRKPARLNLRVFVAGRSNNG
jgi:hypothetical protein